MASQVDAFLAEMVLCFLDALLLFVEAAFGIACIADVPLVTVPIERNASRITPAGTFLAAEIVRGGVW